MRIIFSYTSPKLLSNLCHFIPYIGVSPLWNKSPVSYPMCQQWCSLPGQSIVAIHILLTFRLRRWDFRVQHLRLTRQCHMYSTTNVGNFRVFGYNSENAIWFSNPSSNKSQKFRRSESIYSRFHHFFSRMRTNAVTCISGPNSNLLSSFDFIWCRILAFPIGKRCHS